MKEVGCDKILFDTFADEVHALRLIEFDGFLVAKGKRSGDISSTDILADEWPGFWKAVEKDTNIMIEKNREMTPLSTEESSLARRLKPDRMVRNRLHLRSKPVDTPDGNEKQPKLR